MEIVYVGHGTNERAWRCTTLNEQKTANYGHRSSDHTAWCQDLIRRGWLPSDWVQIVERNLDKSAACIEEQRLVRLYRPKFNQPLGEKLLKIKGEILSEAKRLREQGLSYLDIGREIGFSTMAIWRALNGKNKNG